MNRAERRARERNAPAYFDLRSDIRRSKVAQYRAAKAAAMPAPEVDVTEEQLRAAGITANDGDKITISGLSSRRVNGIVRVVRNCKPGDETPFIIRVKS